MTTAQVALLVAVTLAAVGVVLLAAAV